MISIQVPFVLIFAVVQLSAAEYVIYGRLTKIRLTTIDNSLSLNPNRCHHPLITQLSEVIIVYLYSYNYKYIIRYIVKIQMRFHKVFVPIVPARPEQQKVHMSTCQNDQFLA